jgi:hypothetical protein
VPVHFRRVPDDNDVPAVRGTYRRVLEYWAEHAASKSRPNTYWAELCCPGCGRVALLGGNHAVAAGGAVTPSDVCPFDAAWVANNPGSDLGAPCSFHDFIVLDDWDRPSTPRRR